MVITVKFRILLMKLSNLPKRFASFRNNPGKSDGIRHITRSKNNTLITLTDIFGDVITWTTCRDCGFAGGQKATARATITTVEEMGLRAIDRERKAVNIIFHGGRKFRSAVTRGLARSQVAITSFILEVVLPYNGCRKKKPRRK